MKELEIIAAIRNAAELRVEAAKENIDNGPDGTLASALSALIVELERIPQLETLGADKALEHQISEEELLKEITQEINDVNLEDEVGPKSESESQNKPVAADDDGEEEPRFTGPLSILGHGMKKKANGLANGAH